MGTLGGGNHFIEICLDTDDTVWLMLHSGSRNIGKVLAERHIEIARRLKHNEALADRDLAVFLAGTKVFDAYRRDLYWAQEYARFNRQMMLHLLEDVMRKFWPRVTFAEPISCHHNYVAEEVHFGEDLLVTRKGAIRAGRGELGIIPGLDGHGVVHRARARQPAVVLVGVARRRPPDEPQRGAQALHAAGPARIRPPASSAARTRASSTRRPGPTRTSTA